MKVKNVMRGKGPVWGIIALITLGGSAFGALAGQDVEVMPASARVKTTPTIELLSREFQRVARAVEPSVVHIEVHLRPEERNITGAQLEFELPPGFPHEFRRFFDRPWYEDGRAGRNDTDEYQQYDVPATVSMGSGWIFDEKGIIVTNNHVVRSGGSITVKLFDGRELDARVLGADPSTDIAVLQVGRKDLSPARLYSGPIEQGDIVFAFGSPLQFEFSMSQGIVAGTGRQTGILGPTGYEDFIQTDAAINPGNSGGPLTNVRGEVIGMNTAIVSRAGFFNGMGFAVPAPMIREVVEQLVASGKVSRGYLGVLIQDDPLILETFGFEGKGVVVGSVLPDSPAARAGIRRGDIVTQIEGHDVTSSTELRRTIASQRPGSTARMHVVRNAEPLDLSVVLAEVPAGDSGPGAQPGSGSAMQARPVETLKKLGIERSSSLGDQAAARLGMEGVSGVLVEVVRPHSVAATAGLAPGDVISEVMDQPVRTTDEFANALDPLISKQQTVRLTVRSKDASRYVALRLPQ